VPDSPLNFETHLRKGNYPGGIRAAWPTLGLPCPARQTLGEIVHVPRQLSPTPEIPPGRPPALFLPSRRGVSAGGRNQPKISGL